MYIPKIMINKITPLCSLKLSVEKFGHYWFVSTKKDWIKVPKVFKQTNEITYQLSTTYLSYLLIFLPLKIILLQWKKSQQTVTNYL